MKVTAILLFRVKNAVAQPVLLASAMDLTSFSFFERKPAREFLLFSCRTISMRTENGVRHCVKEGDYVICAYNKDGLCGLICTDDAYPRNSAFACLRKAMEDYDAESLGAWKQAEVDSKAPVPCVDACLAQGQDPTNVDKLARVQSKIVETRSAVETSMKALLNRGEKLEDLAAQSDDLSMEAKMFMKRSKELNKCCTIL